MGLLHLAQGVAVLILANDFTLPVVATFMTGAPGQAPPEPDHLFDVSPAWGVAIFLFMSTLARLLIVSPGIYRWYRANLRKKRNHARWIEYSLSSSLMVVLIALLVGIADTAALVAIAGVNASMILFGPPPGEVRVPRRGRRLAPLLVRCDRRSGALGGDRDIPLHPGSGVSAPGFFYASFFSLFAFFNGFTIVMVLQYRRVGRWAEYEYGEYTYILLSLVARSALAWQVFGGTLAVQGKGLTADSR